MEVVFANKPAIKKMSTTNAKVGVYSGCIRGIRGESEVYYGCILKGAL